MSDSEEETRNTDILTDLTISTISMNGTISNVSPDDKEDINDLICMDRIVEISNNFKCITTPEYEEYKKNHTKKQRDTEKSKSKKKKKARKHISESKGDNTHQSSQITFVIRSDILDVEGNHRYYKIKLFRKGAVQIPGVIDESYEDIGMALNVLVNYLRIVYENDEIRMTELYTSMKNYICKLVYDHFRFNLTKLRDEFNTYKNQNPFKQDVLDLLFNMGFPIIEADTEEDSDFHSSDDDGFIDVGLPKKPTVTNIKKIKRYKMDGIRDIIRIMCGHTKEQIAEVIKDTDKSVSSVSIKFYRIAPNVFRVPRGKDPKRTTIKIMQSGKVNFEGGNGYTEIAMLRKWLMEFVKVRSDIVLGTIKQPYVIESDLSDSGESVYADFIPVPRRKK